MQPPDGLGPNTIVDEAGKALAQLEPGALAALRRETAGGDGLGAPIFWRMAVRFGIGTSQEETWARIFRIMALLTSKGRNDSKISPHNPRHPLGRALCDGGSSRWGEREPDPQPVFSEPRLARLLSARGAMRADLLERAARRLARTDVPAVGVNCAEFAWLLLAQDNATTPRAIARAYYRRLDRVKPASANNTDEISGEQL